MPRRLWVQDLNSDGASDVTVVGPRLPVISGHVTEATTVLMNLGDGTDANDDGLTDVSDAVALLEFLFLNSDPLPPPRDCGQDPTPDALGCEEFAACPSAEG